VAFAVGLLHETQHSLLNATTYLFDLIETPHTPGYSPWRDDPRPTSGILHGAYAYLAVTRFWRAEAAAGNGQAAKDRQAAEDRQTAGARQAAEDRQTAGTRQAARNEQTAGNGQAGRNEQAAGKEQAARNEQAAQQTARKGLAAFEFARWREAVADVAHRLLADDVLTAAGRRFVGALRDEVEPWRAEPVDPEIERLARAANTDHRLRWRLRNLTLAPDDLERLSRAWRAGTPPPDVTPRLVPATRRALESSRRLDLIHATVKGDPPPQPGGRATAGDAAFLRGDHGTAESAYLDRVCRDPDDDAAWAGLALVTGGADRLECCKALAKREKEHPIAVYRWISRQ
jgi:hypothetical protein